MFFEFDEYEDKSTHYLLCADNYPVATARFRLNAKDTAKIERIAVLKEHRNKGLGRKLVEHVSKDLKGKPDIKKIVMSAQDYALPFYEKLGYTVVGEGYMEAGIPHHKIIMEIKK